MFAPLAKQLQGHEREHEEAEHEEQEDVGDLWQRVADAAEGSPNLPGKREAVRDAVPPLAIPPGSNTYTGTGQRSGMLFCQERF